MKLLASILAACRLKPLTACKCLSHSCWKWRMSKYAKVRLQAQISKKRNSKACSGSKWTIDATHWETQEWEALDHAEDQRILISPPECGLCSSLLYHHGKLPRPSEIHFKRIPGYKKGFPGGTVGKNPLANAGDSRDGGLISGSGRSPGEGMETHYFFFSLNPLFLPGKFHRQRSQAVYSPGDCKELAMTEHAHTHERIHGLWLLLHSVQGALIYSVARLWKLDQYFLFSFSVFFFFNEIPYLLHQ